MRTDERDEHRRLVADAGQLVAKRGHDRAGQGPRARRARGGEAVRERALTHDGGYGTVAGGGLDHMTASERGPPQRDPIVVDAVEVARVRERCGPVAELAL